MSAGTFLIVGTIIAGLVYLLRQANVSPPIISKGPVVTITTPQKSNDVRTPIIPIVKPVVVTDKPIAANPGPLQWIFTGPVSFTNTDSSPRKFSVDIKQSEALRNYHTSIKRDIGLGLDFNVDLDFTVPDHHGQWRPLFVRGTELTNVSPAIWVTPDNSIIVRVFDVTKKGWSGMQNIQSSEKVLLGTDQNNKLTVSYSRTDGVLRVRLNGHLTTFNARPFREPGYDSPIYVASEPTNPLPQLAGLSINSISASFK